MAAMEANAERRVVGKEGVTHYFMKAGNGTHDHVSRLVEAWDVFHRLLITYVVFMECNDDRAYKTWMLVDMSLMWGKNEPCLWQIWHHWMHWSHVMQTVVIVLCLEVFGKNVGWEGWNNLRLHYLWFHRSSWLEPLQCCWPNHVIMYAKFY